MMGFVFKSAIGLGAVYFAMFSSTPPSVDLGPAASFCTAAAKSHLAGQASMRAQWAAAGCGVAVAAVVEKATALPTFAPALAAPAASPPLAKPAGGSLTAADLREPWFGPSHLSRKGAKRG